MLSVVSTMKSSELGFVELYTHENILHTLCKVATQGDYNISVFTTENIRKSLIENSNLKNENINFITLKTDENIRDFLNRIEQKSKDLDLIMVNSFYERAHRIPYFWFFSPDCKFVWWIYNTKSWLYGLSFEKKISGNINTILRKPILSNMDAIIIEYEPIIRYLKSDPNINMNADMFSFAPTLFENRSNKENNERVHYVVPGRIEQSRRNYKLVCQVFESLAKEYGSQIKLTFLGQPHDQYGEKIIQWADRLNRSDLEVDTFNQWIPIDTYHTVIQDATFLLCPLREKIRSSGSPEIYGKTKGSGNIWDAIQNATPLILPQSFPVAEYIESSTYKYTSRNELQSFIIKSVINERLAEEMCSNALENSRSFCLQDQQKRFSSIISSILE